MAEGRQEGQEKYNIKESAADAGTVVSKFTSVPGLVVGSLFYVSWTGGIFQVLEFCSNLATSCQLLY